MRCPQSGLRVPLCCQSCPAGSAELGPVPVGREAALALLERTDPKDASLGTCWEACFCLQECLAPTIPTDTAPCLLAGMEGPPWERPCFGKSGSVSFSGRRNNTNHSCFSHYKPSAHVWCTWGCQQQGPLCQELQYPDIHQLLRTAATCSTMSRHVQVLHGHFGAFGIFPLPQRIHLFVNKINAV